MPAQQGCQGAFRGFGSLALGRAMRCKLGRVQAQQPGGRHPVAADQFDRVAVIGIAHPASRTGGRRRVSPFGQRDSANSVSPDIGDQCRVQPPAVESAGKKGVSLHQRRGHGLDHLGLSKPQRLGPDDAGDLRHILWG